MITVLICTRDRTKSLPLTLDSIFQSGNLAESGWEVLVGYGPSDSGETRGICQQFQQRFPDRFRFFLEKRPGKSNALNAGMSITNGEILALTDDDVICAPNYIRSIRETFEQYEVDGVQGRVLLNCEGGQPSWMGDELAAFMSRRDFGDRVFDWHDNLTGTNMLVRKEAALNIGGFSPQIGASAVGFMEDSEFSIRLRNAGGRFIYAPQILVHHQLPKERLSKQFFLERYFRFGRSEAYLRPLGASLVGMSVYTFRCVIRGYLGALWQTLIRKRAAAFFLVCDTRRELGYIWQHWLFHLRKATPLVSPGLQNTDSRQEAGSRN